jgi:thiamine transport system substrate-binding protein
MTTTLAPLRRLAALAALAVVATACGDDGDDTASPEPDDDAPEVVRLVTYDSFALSDEAAAAFEERTGATIEVVASGDAGTTLTRALLAAGAPEGDVIFGIDDTLAGRALAEDLLEPVTPAGLDRVPDELRIEGEGADLLVPIDTGDVCMNVDTEWFADNQVTMPETLDDLTREEFRDLTVVQSPVTSSPGLAFLIGTIDRYGEDGWEDYWSALDDNGVLVRPSWDDAYYGDYTVSGGDRPVVLSYASSPPAEVVFSEGTRTEPASAVMIDSCTRQIEYAGVLRGTDRPDLAAELVEFMLDEAWQSELPLTNFVFPVVDVDLPEEFELWAERAESPMGLDPVLVDERRDDWIEAWRELME